MNDLLQLSRPTFIQHPPNSNIYIAFVLGKDLLKHLVIPDIQREINQTRVDELVIKLQEEYSKNGFYDFGTLLICYYNDNLYLLNGQHRYCALKNIINIYNINISVKIEVRKAKTKENMEKLWAISNDNREVKLVKNSSHQNIINGLRKHLNQKYQNYISDAKKPHKPNINLNHLAENMDRLRFLDILHTLSLGELILEVEKINNYYSKNCYDIELWKKWKIPAVEENLDKCMKKSPVNSLFLGLFQNFEWLQRIMTHLEHNIDYEDMPHYLISASSRKIGKKLRSMVWDKYNSFSKIKARGDNFASCYVCRKMLEHENFQCGHIIPFFYGGENTIDNLEPVCGSCNTDMRLENLYRYKKRMFPVK